MWLYLPDSGDFRYAEASGALILDSISPCERLEQYASWNTKHSQPGSWSRAWLKAPWLARLSGVTLHPSTAARGAESWIISLRAIPALPSPWPAAGAEKTTLVTSGPTSGGSSPSADPGSSSSRTSGTICGLDSTAWSKIYADWVTRLTREYTVRRKWALRTVANGSLSSPSDGTSWTTPCAEDSALRSTPYAQGGLPLSMQVEKNWAIPAASDTKDPSCTTKGGTSAALQAKNWPTPTSAEALGESSGARKSSLRKDAKNWPTPTTAPEAENRNSNTKNGPTNLGDAARAAWPTPRAEDSEQVGNHLGPNSHAGDSLGAVAKDWPTPNTADAHRDGTHKRGNATLPKAAKSLASSANSASPSGLVPTTERKRETSSPDGMSMNSTPAPTSPDSKGSSEKLQKTPMEEPESTWATPQSHDGHRPNPQLTSTQGKNLMRQTAMWATPTTRDLKDSPGQTVEENCLLGRQAQTDVRSGERSLGDGRKLNPLFDEWLIGWPIGWTCPCPDATGAPSDFARWETASFRSLQRLLSLYWRSGTASEVSSDSRKK